MIALHFAISYRHLPQHMWCGGDRHTVGRGKLSARAWMRLGATLAEYCSRLRTPVQSVRVWWDQVLASKRPADAAEGMWTMYGLLPYAMLQVVYADEVVRDVDSSCAADLQLTAGLLPEQLLAQYDWVGTRLWLRVEAYLAALTTGVVMHPTTVARMAAQHVGQAAKQVWRVHSTPEQEALWLEHGLQHGPLPRRAAGPAADGHGRVGGHI